MDNKNFVKMLSLLGRGTVLIRLPSATVPDVRLDDRLDGHLYAAKAEMPTNLMLVSHVTDYGSNLCLVSYVWEKEDDMRTRSRYFSSDMVVELVNAEEGRAFFDKYGNYVMKNLSTELAHGFSIGSDPEIFVQDGDGEMIPAYMFLGSKEHPDKTPGGVNCPEEWMMFNRSGGNTMYWDGFQAEFTTTPGPCMEYHTDSIAAGLRGVLDAAKKKYPKARLAIRSVFDIPFETLMDAKEEHVAFGCMPSINAYGMRVDMPPAREVPFRSAGGHIHFGLGKINEDKALPIVKALDAILGVACVSLFARFDDPKRRVLYGLPGEFRLPPHGLEYRPLSNAWLCHPFIANLVVDFARKVVIFAQKDCLRHWKGNEEETCEVIIRCDANKAREILQRNKDIVKGLLHAAYNWSSPEDREKMFNIFVNGMESVIAEPSNFEVNWGMTSDQPWKERCRGRNVIGMWHEIAAGKKLGKAAQYPAPPPPAR